MKNIWPAIIMAAIFLVDWLWGFGVGVDVGYRQGHEAAIREGRCPHERMVNYDLERAIATCQSLKREIDNAQDHLAKSIEFMDQVKEKLGEAE